MWFGKWKQKKKSKKLLHIIMHSSPHLFMNVFLFLILLGINWHIQLMPPFKYHMFNTVLEKFPFSSLSNCVFYVSVFSHHIASPHIQEIVMQHSSMSASFPGDQLRAVPLKGGIHNWLLFTHRDVKACTWT